MDWDKIPDQAGIERVMAGLRERNFNPVLVADRHAALQKIKQMVPAGAEVMTGASTTLEEVGFTSLLAGGKHSWNNWKNRIFSEEDPERQLALRRLATAAEYFLGSVQAIAETGEVLGADATGSRQAGYVYSAQHVIWVVGVNKIVMNLDMCFRRLREHCVPLEDARMKRTGAPGTYLGKIVIYEREGINGRVHTILVREKLGF